MKLFLASGGCDTPIYNEKTPDHEQLDKLLVLLSKKSSQSDLVELKTDQQAKNMVSVCATTTKRRLRDADSYASNPAEKYWIQEKNRRNQEHILSNESKMAVRSKMADHNQIF
jgi:hypothetical protein